ncbi:hypothetical protein Lesp02_04250 [Lentzea sp. NBRC 105346]|uniref:hypothetical protein n=1 Tax=Lentzea sp. NBRC 105346 TaxID=3032205 RepID=UPI0024A027BC|nr:hypothetical protein [Lentzea sp. NBRC 105346]GLZ28235.1 hypothetical protein Lesp02_04250 [Lentzea sp. NBRC 105346]
MPEKIVRPLARTRSLSAPSSASRLVQSQAQRLLPVGELAQLPSSTAFQYDIAVMDDHGRIASKAILRDLGWSPGHVVDMSAVNGNVVIQSRPGSAFRVTSKGLVQIPARIRHWCSLSSATRVLLVAAPSNDLLVVTDIAVLDELVRERCAALSEGDAS